MKNYIFTILLLTGTFHLTNAQNFHSKGTYSMVTALSFGPASKFITGPETETLRSFSLTGIIGYNYSDRSSMGIGVSLNNYFNTLGSKSASIPLFINGRWGMGSEDFFSFAQIGYALPISNDLDKGVYGALGLGYDFLKLKKNDLKIQLSYNYQHIEQYIDPIYGSDGITHSVKGFQIGIGLGFLSVVR